MAKKPFLPDWVSAPGETITDFLDERGLSVDAFTFVASPRDLIHGKTRIDAEIARRLTEVLGGSEQFWLNRDQQYVEDCERLGMKPGGLIPEKEFWRRVEKKHGPYPEAKKRKTKKRGP